MKKQLKSVTLLGVDCVNIDRLILAADICQNEFEFADVKLLSSLPSADPRVVPIKKIPSTKAYSKFAIAELDSYVDTPHVLVIQYDGFILNPSAWSDEYLKYDYIGAPWLVQDWSVRDFGFPPGLLRSLVVGNGGFSLRSKKFTALSAELVKLRSFKQYHPEDVVLCVHNRQLLESRGIQFAPVPLARQFSFEAESKDNDIWDNQFGFHGLSWTDISKWLDAHPEFKDKIVNDVTRHRRKLAATI